MQTVVRRCTVALGPWVALLSWVGRADAAPPRRETSGPLFVQADTGQQAGTVARTRATKGDCAAALEAFDAALRTSTDPTLHRDRGLCHEQLGHPYPAIDDYRAYLTASPDAADTEQIRERLVRLEESVGVGGPGAKGESSAPTPAESRTKTGNASMSVSADTSAGVSAEGSSTASSAPAGSKSQADYDDEDASWRKWEMAESSALRLSDGDIFGAYFGVRRMTDFTNVSSYAVGATIRKSFSRVSTLFGEIGYVNYKGSSSLNLLLPGSNVTNFSTVNAGGIGLAVGYEARIRLDQYATNALLAGGGLEFQHISDSNSDLSSSHLLPRGKFGYRHVFGPAIGLELVVDGGYFLGIGSNLVLANSTMFGGTVALTIAF